jgi:hypothetical protein
MSLIPKDYAKIEISDPYRGAQMIGLSVVKCIETGEYWHFFDSQELRLLYGAKPRNVTFHLNNSLSDYSVHVGLEGYVRGPESYTRIIRRILLGIFGLEPPPALQGTVGRPNQKNLTLHLPPERESEIFQQLSSKQLTATIQAAFAREYRTLCRVYRNNPDARLQVLKELEGHYEKAMKKIIC